MPYVIRYYKNGHRIGSTPGPAPLPKTKTIADAGLIRRKADCYRIIDRATGKEMALGRAKGQPAGLHERRREEQSED